MNLNQNILADQIQIGIGEFAVGRVGQKLVTVVGSCLALMLYDRAQGIGGMLHIMLGRHDGHDPKLGKYADKGIPILHKNLIAAGAHPSNLVMAKVVGGAKMLGDSLNVGQQNLAVTIEVLSQMGIQIVAADCGGKLGRKVTFNIETGKVQVEHQAGQTRVL